jgi:glutathione S-transferase
MSVPTGRRAAEPSRCALPMLRLYRFRYSTNVERVALALAHKRLEVESVWIDPADRAPVREASGQDLVPVLVDGDRVIPDSTAVIEHLEARFPEPPLYPADRARRAEVAVFIDWFNRVWKVAPNALADALDAGGDPEDPKLRAHARQIQEHLDVFAGLLTGREHLFGPFSAADCAAWPFVRYAAHLDEDDTETFHRVIHEHQRLDPQRHAGVAAWIDRVAQRPMA